MFEQTIDKLESDRVNQRKMQGDRISQVITNIEPCTVTSQKNVVPNQSIDERIDPKVLEVFENNPYTQPLNSAPNNTCGTDMNNVDTAVSGLPSREEEDQIAEAKRQAMHEWQAQQQ